MSGQSGDPLTFESNVSYVNTFTSTQDPPYADTWSGWSANAEVAPVYSTSQASQLHQVTAMQPLGTSIASAINTTDNNPNNDSINEIIQPPNPNYPDPPAFAQNRLYNKAGILVQINGSTKTITGQNGVTLTTAQKTAISNALTAKTTIYDQREGTNVNVTSVNVGTLDTTLNALTGFNNVLYIYDTTSSSTPNAIRLINGGVLPSNGLTVASMNPVYIQGDYNTGTTNNPTAVPANVSNSSDTASPTVSGYTRVPAAVIGDAVMLLSNSWSDSNSSLSLSSRNAPSSPALCPPAFSRPSAPSTDTREARITFPASSKIGPAITALTTAPWWSSSPARFSPDNGIREISTPLPSAVGTSTPIIPPPLHPEASAP